MPHQKGPAEFLTDSLKLEPLVTINKTSEALRRSDNIPLLSAVFFWPPIRGTESNKKCSCSKKL